MIPNEAELIAAHATETEAARVAAEAAKKAKEEAEHAEYRERRRQERVANNLKLQPIYEGIVAAVRARDVGCEYNASDARIFINGVDMMYYLDIITEYRKTSSFRLTATGRKRVTVGDYGNRTSYPQRKDGSHNYPEIAARLIAIAAERNAKKQIERIQHANSGVAAEVMTELKASPYHGPFSVQASANPAAPVTVTVKICKNMTADQARAFHALLKPYLS